MVHFSLSVGSSDNTKVQISYQLDGRINEKILFVNSSQYAEVSTATNLHMSIIASNPVLVAQFEKGYQADSGTIGDPLMIFLTPTDLFYHKYTFTTLDFKGEYTHFVTMIGQARETSGLQLNAKPIHLNWTSISDTKYSSAVITLASGVYTLSHKDFVGFGVYIYGHRYMESYGTEVARVTPLCPQYRKEGKCSSLHTFILSLIIQC